MLNEYLNKSKSASEQKRNMEKRKNVRFPDLRPAFIFVCILGLVLLVGYLAFSIKVTKELSPFLVILIGIYFLIVGFTSIIQLVRYHRFQKNKKVVDGFTTEFADFFRYVADTVYCICDKEGLVKLVSVPLQEILNINSQVCNKQLADFCDVRIDDVISVAHIGKPVSRIYKSDDGVPTDETRLMRTEIDGKMYDLKCYAIRSHGEEYYVIQFTDVTRILELEKQIDDSEPIVAFVVIDSLQELAQYIRVNYKTVVSAIDTTLKEWAASFGGMLREYDREKYLLIFKRATLMEELEGKFPILSKVRNLQLGDGSYPVTISIGVGNVEGSFEDKERAASDALDFALQKGGDQAAVNDGLSITPYGGRVNTLSTSTTVASRVNSQHLCTLMKEASNVLIMAHKNPDYDAIGSCLGLARLAYCARGKDPDRIRIVINRSHANFRACLPLLGDNSYYRSIFVSGESAMSMVHNNTLIVLSDVNNVKNVEKEDLLKANSNVVIVDHHRRTNDTYVFKPLMTYIRPGVSAASELVSEMLELGPYHEELPRVEANLLLAGMMLDTKNFTNAVSTRTFSALQYLYGHGAHANIVRELFTESMNSLFTACDIDSRTRTYRDKIALTWLSVDHAATEDDIVQVAKAADKLMNIDGIEASFALLRAEANVTISARSHDKINVANIMQTLGGGGHYDMAGTKLKNTTLDEACRQLKDAIDTYLDNDYYLKKN